MYTIQTCPLEQKRSESNNDQILDIPVTPTAEVRQQQNSSLISPGILTAAIIASCYFSNIGVLLLNKYLLSFYDFRKSTAVGKFFKILALSVIFCISVVCGNTSLRYLPVSFNQVIGATTPFFTAIFAFVITFKKESVEVYVAHVPVVLGIVLASNSEPQFHLFGFLMCVGSTAGRALKSVVQSLLLSSDGEKLHFMNLLLYMAPMEAMILLPFTLYIEGNVLSATVEKARGDGFMVFLLIRNATVAYLVNLTNFLVTKHTSTLTL
ncbi:hypothetical protein ACS0TY_015616 [Phlomoides rotata]